MIKYCSQCGGKSIQKKPKDDNRMRSVCSVCGHIDYENPKIVTGILPIYKDEILLCKRAIEPQKDKWTIPSGFMENQETVAEGALREAAEEAGIKPQISSLYTLYNLPHIGQVYLLYLGILPNKKTDPGIETLETKFFTHEQIPWQEIAFTSVTFALKHFISDYKANKFPLHTGCYTKT